MNTKHATDCKMSFGRLDSTCPRCAELAIGATPRTGGWDRFKRNQRLEAQRIQDIRNHDCKRSGCMPVCTFGDW